MKKRGEFVRTTIRIPEELIWEIKKKALTERKTLTEAITEGLRLYLSLKAAPIDEERIESLFGAWGEGERGKVMVERLRRGKKEEAM